MRMQLRPRMARRVVAVRTHAFVGCEFAERDKAVEAARRPIRGTLIRRNQDEIVVALAQVLPHLSVERGWKSLIGHAAHFRPEPVEIRELRGQGDRQQSGSVWRLPRPERQRERGQHEQVVRRPEKPAGRAQAVQRPHDRLRQRDIDEFRAPKGDSCGRRNCGAHQHEADQTEAGADPEATAPIAAGGRHR